MSTPTYSDRIEAVRHWLAGADFILIGAGAGLSAAAGLNYQDPALFQKWYPAFAGLGLNTIWEAIVAHWTPDDMNRRRFWAFWAYHIQKIRYDAQPGTAYLNLARLLLGKPYFVITTNVDAQFAKAGFRPELMFTPQGDYGKLQCATPCNDVLYDSRDLVRKLIANSSPKPRSQVGVFIEKGTHSGGSTGLAGIALTRTVESGVRNRAGAVARRRFGPKLRSEVGR